MKKLMILFLVLVPVFGVYAQDKSFKKLSEAKGITVVHVSKSMLNMMGNMKTQGMDIGSISGKLNAISIFTADSPAGIKTIKDGLENILKEGKYERTLFVKDDDSSTVFYNRKIKSKSDDETEILMVVEDKEMVLIRLIGNITENDLKQMADQQNNRRSVSRQTKHRSSPESIADIRKQLNDAEKDLDKMTSAMDSDYNKSKAEVEKYEKMVKDGKRDRIRPGELGGFQGKLGGQQGKLGGFQGRVGAILGRLGGLQSKMTFDQKEVKELQDYAARLQKKAGDYQKMYGDLQKRCGDLQKKVSK